MTTDLETEIYAVASLLHRSVADLPIDAPPRRSGRSPVVLGGVVLLAVAVTTAAIATRDDKAIKVTATPVADVQGMIADPVPAGLQASWAGEQTASGVAGTGAGVDGNGGGLVEGHAMGLATYLYGDASAAASPFESSDLVVNVWDASELPTDGAAQASGAIDGVGNALPVTVRGHEGMICSPPSCVGDSDIAATTLWWHETQDIEVVLASRTLNAEQLVAIAEGLTIEPDDVALGTLPGGLGGPLDELGRLHDTAVAGSRDTVARWVGYTDPANATERYVDVTTLAGDRADLMALVWEMGADRQLTVRGQRSWIATIDSGVDVSGDTAAGLPQQLHLLWREASGVLVHVTAVGVSEAELVSLVEGLHPATDEEWQEVKDLVSSAQAAAVPRAAEAATDATETGGADVSATTEASSPAGADANAGVAIDAGVVAIEAGLHADLGAEAIIGAAQNGAGQVVSGIDEGVRSAPETDLVDQLP